MEEINDFWRRQSLLGLIESDLSYTDVYRTKYAILADWFERHVRRVLPGKRPAFEGGVFDHMLLAADVLREVEKTFHVVIRARGLVELNHHQAGMLMEKDLKIRQLKELKMKSTQEVIDEVTMNNIIPFEEIKAKMAGKLPPDGNWLNAFKPGTRFLAYSKLNTSSVLGDFILGTDPKELPAVYLGYENGPQSFGWRWHDPVKFCKEFGLYSILEVSDGNIDKVPEGTVEGDGKLKVVDPVHEE